MTDDAFHGQPIDIVTLHRIDADPRARTFIHDRTRQAQLAGAIPDRAMPEDDSMATIAVTPSNHWAGFATWYETNTKQLWLDVLWVDPAWRRRGVAMRLLEAVRQASRQAKLRGVATGHFEGNAPMVALMQRAGWPVDHIVRAIPADALFARTEA